VDAGLPHVHHSPVPGRDRRACDPRAGARRGDHQPRIPAPGSRAGARPGCASLIQLRRGRLRPPFFLSLLTGPRFYFLQAGEPAVRDCSPRQQSAPAGMAVYGEGSFPTSPAHSSPVKKKGPQFPAVSPPLARCVWEDMSNPVPVGSPRKSAAIIPFVKLTSGLPIGSGRNWLMIWAHWVNRT
jgi:hypothetical protein